MDCQCTYMCVYVCAISALQITNMKARGLQFMTIPDTYYDQLREKLKDAKITVKEDLDVVIIYAPCLPANLFHLE